MIKVYKFKNGATLIYERLKGKPTIGCVMGFKGGAYTEKIPGLAHFCEHMWFRGTPLESGQSIRTSLENFGVEQNGATCWRSVSLEFVCQKQMFPVALAYNSEMILNTEFDETKAENEKKVIYEEMSLLGGQNVSKLANLLEIHPQASINAIGTKKSVKSIKVEDIKNYAEENFGSENFIISVAGDISFNAVKKMVKKSVVDFLPSNPDKEVFFQSAETRNLRGLIVAPSEDETVTVSVLMKYGKSNLSALDYSMFFIEDYLLNGLAGQLHTKLRSENPLMYAGQYNNFVLPGGKYKQLVINTNAKRVNKCLRVCAEIIKNLAGNGIDQNTLDTIKTKAKITLKMLEQDTEESSSDNFETYLTGCSFIDNKGILKKVIKMNLEEVNLYFKEILGKAPILPIIQGNVKEDKILKYPNIISLFDAYGYRKEEYKNLLDACPEINGADFFEVLEEIPAEADLYREDIILRKKDLKYLAKRFPDIVEKVRELENQQDLECLTTVDTEEENQM